MYPYTITWRGRWGMRLERGVFRLYTLDRDHRGPRCLIHNPLHFRSLFRAFSLLSSLSLSIDLGSGGLTFRVYPLDDYREWPKWRCNRAFNQQDLWYPAPRHSVKLGNCDGVDRRYAPSIRVQRTKWYYIFVVCSEELELIANATEFGWNCEIEAFVFCVLMSCDW